MLTLLQFLQKQGYSRRNILTTLTQGQIFINHKKAENLKEILKINDKLQYQEECFYINNKDFQQEADILLLFNKPKGVLVSKKDPHHQKTIYDLLPQKYQNFYYIGRLDKESRGLLLLTNSPKLVNQYEHPKFNIQKEYLITVQEVIKQEDLKKMKIWIIDQGETLSFVEIISITPYQYKITLNEWKKRHIRRVIKALHYTLTDLQRIKEGERTLGNLKEGEYQEKKVI